MITVAETILAQLGGTRFIAMTGAKDIVGGDNSLSFSIGRNKSRANKVRITYNPSTDLYDMEFARLSKYDWKKIWKRYDLDVEQMRLGFIAFTGLELSL